MAYYDRGYGRDGGGGDSVGQRILGFLNRTFPIGTYGAVRVQVHITFILLVGVRLLLDKDPAWTVRWTSLLFGSVLLHEFGHVLTCRAVGGQSDEILIWPLGGLAFCAPPRRPWPEFVTVAGGPLVNVLIAGTVYVALLAALGDQIPVSLNPMRIFVGPRLEGVQGLMVDLVWVNYLLLIFNLVLVFYPFDVGRLVQIALWTKLGYERSLSIATRVGMVGAVGIGLYGLAHNTMLLLLIAVFGFYVCYQQARALRYGVEGADLYGGGEAVGGYGTVDRGPGFFERRRAAKAQRRAEEEARRARAEEAEVDRILAKVSSDGLDSLSGKEKRTLQKATEKKRGV